MNNRRVIRIGDEIALTPANGFSPHFAQVLLVTDPAKGVLVAVQFDGSEVITMTQSAAITFASNLREAGRG